MKSLDLNFIRSQFPALSNDWVFMDNAGGSQTVKQVGERINDYLYNTNVQLGATYDVSQQASNRVLEAQRTMAGLIHAMHPESCSGAFHYPVTSKSFQINGSDIFSGR
ncbi:MAG: hypothetical protein R2764_10025 [Bacteroidales bacterium]